MGLERGERVVGDLGLGRRDAADERALAGVREADERDVGHELQLEAQPALLAGLALLGEARAPGAGWRGTGRCPARPARRPRPASGRRGGTRSARTVAAVEVAARRCPRARRPPGRRPRRPCRSLPLPWAPLVGPAVGVVAEGEQRGHVAVGDEPDVAALAAVAAVGAAVDDRALPPEADAARAAVAAADVQPALVDEGGHGRSRLPGHLEDRRAPRPRPSLGRRRRRRRRRRGSSVRDASSLGVGTGRARRIGAMAPSARERRMAHPAYPGRATTDRERPGRRRWAATRRPGSSAPTGTRTRWPASPRLPPGRAGGGRGRRARPGRHPGARAPAAAQREEEPDPWRTCFERDRDRILHAAAFRRLAGKTQVFVFPDDHQRTRLTHALEVAQVARGVAPALGLNVALTEAIALGHDCGHGPGGHASEDALSPYVAEGYDHAVWGADVVLAPLNLCAETLDGVRNHSWSRPAPATPEGEVVVWADRIAYVCHDFEDAVVGRHRHARRCCPRGRARAVRRRAAAAARRRSSTPWSTPALATGRDRAWPRRRPRRWPRSASSTTSTSTCGRRRWPRPTPVIAVLRALVEHYADRPNLLPADRQDGRRGRQRRRRCAPRSPTSAA